MSLKIDHLQRMTLKKDYADFKARLDQHAKTAFKYATFQEYVTAAEQKLGRRLITHEINYLFDNASTTKGKPFRWQFSIGHPKGRYVYERPIHNIYSRTDKSEADLAIERGNFEDNRNIFVREDVKKRPPRMDLRKKRKPNVSDPDKNKDDYQDKKDLYDTAKGSKDSIKSNYSLLQNYNVDNLPYFVSKSIGGPDMVKVLNSSVGEVKDLLENITDGMPIRVAVSRLVRAGYSPRVSREIIADAEEVGAISIKARRVFAEIKAEDVPEKLIPMTKHESQEAGQGFEDGEMSHDGKPHDWQTEVGDKLEKGEMSPNLDTKIAARLAKKIEKISGDIERIEQRLNTVEKVAEEAPPTLADIERDLDGLQASVEKLSTELDGADSKDVEANAKNYKPEVVDYEAYPAGEKGRTMEVDTLNDHNYQKSSAKDDKKVMDIAMGDEKTYAAEAKAIQKNDKEVVDKVKAARDRRTQAKQDCKDCDKQ